MSPATITLYWKAITDKGTALIETGRQYSKMPSAADEKAVQQKETNPRKI